MRHIRPCIVTLVLLAPFTAQAAQEDHGGKRLVRNFMDGLHSGDLDAVGATLCPDLVYRLNGMSLTKVQFMSHVEAAYRQYPDFFHHIEELLTVGEKVILRAKDTATDAAIGREMVGGQITIYAVSDGCIREAWEEFTWWTQADE